MQQRQQKISLVVQISNTLRTLIVNGEFMPGSKLKIDTLAARFEASTGIVRECLSRLSAEGLVTALPQRGFIVTPISRAELVELIDVRVAVERHCLAASIEHGDVEWESALLAAAHRLAAQTRLLTPEADRETMLDWQKLHAEFHSALTAACGNRWWLGFRQQLFVQSERYRLLSGQVHGGLPAAGLEKGRDISAEHAALAEAALDRDIPRATDLIETHLRKTVELLLSSPRMAKVWELAAQ